VSTTEIEQPSGVVESATPPSIRPAPASLAVSGQLLARRRRITALRRLVLLVDGVLLIGVAGLGLGTGHGVATVMALWVALTVIAHVCAADSPRSITAIRAVAKVVALIGGAACALNAALGSRADGRQILVGAALMGIVLVLPRVLLRRLPALATRHGLGLRRRLIVGDPQALEGNALRRAPAVASGELILVVTRADPDQRDGSSSRRSGDHLAIGLDKRQERGERGGPAGVVERVVRTALESGAERVTVVPGDSWGQPQLRELSWLLEGTGIDMVISTNLDGIAPHRVDVIQQDGRLMIRVGSASPHGTQALLKGVFDRVVAAVLLLVSTPLLVAVAAVIRLDSEGPAVFRQTRVRERGATFTMYKFRTMTMNAEDQLSDMQELNMHGADRPLFKMEADPRITRIGHLLRKTSLDELPQLVNVLRGQMSLIGPRPALPLEVEMYDYVARRRLAVKPGMTGLWQVSGRSRLTWDESIGFDLDYVDNWSPGTDAAIAVRTFRAVVSKDGAY
jgi:exopolysaccharide biosynthesis polyprenyl glycosylphosphotransferase